MESYENIQHACTLTAFHFLFVHLPFTTLPLSFGVLRLRNPYIGMLYLHVLPTTHHFFSALPPPLVID